MVGEVFFELVRCRSSSYYASKMTSAMSRNAAVLAGTDGWGENKRLLKRKPSIFSLFSFVPLEVEEHARASEA